MNLVGQKFGELTVIKDSGKRASNKGIIWLYQCSCGNYTEVAGNNLKRKKNGTKTCGKCYHGENLVGQKFNLLTVLESTDKRTNGRMVWKCKCDCGNITYVHTANLKNGLVKSCGCLGKFGQHINLVGQKFSKLTPISFIEGGKWLCQCDCGNTTLVNTSNLIAGNTTSCGCQRSKGEFAIQTYLNNHNINFIREKTFNSCRFKDTGALARFDFYLPEQNILIEYDGLQHFISVDFFGGEEKLKQTQEHDKYKNDWCKENNITLIRIPYIKNCNEEKIAPILTRCTNIEEI